MNVSVLKEKIHHYIDQADEHFLTQIYELIQSNQGNTSYHLTQEEQSLIEERLEEYRKNPDAGSSWEEIKKKLLDK